MSTNSDGRGMAHEDRTPATEEAELVAYLDGELTPEAHAEMKRKIARDPALAERLCLLEAGGRPFRQAFDTLLDAAPADRLSVMLERELRRSGRRAEPRRLPAWAAIAASLILFVIGFAAGQGLSSFDISVLPGRWDDDIGGWAGMLASDVALYTPQSLEMIAADRAPSDDELNTIGGSLNVALSSKRLTLPGLELKQARLLAFEGAPFIQLIYLDPRHGAVAFCIFSSSAGAERPESLTGADMNVVYWSDDDMSYMLIGHAPTAELDVLVEALVKEFPPTNA